MLLRLAACRVTPLHRHSEDERESDAFSSDAASDSKPPSTHCRPKGEPPRPVLLSNFSGVSWLSNGSTC